MRLASGIMLASLLSTCVISGTFAKYTTSDTATDEARVAKWGVVVDVEAAGAFATSYDATDADDAKTVKLDVTYGEKDLLAPGTEGTLATYSITGKPEVSVKVTVDVDLELVNWKVNDPAVEYCPVEFKIGETSYKMTTTVEAFELTLEDAIIATLMSDATVTTNGNGKKGVKEYAPNAAALAVSETNVTWAWAFTGNDDAKDTILANKANNELPTISFTLTISVEQVGD